MDVRYQETGTVEISIMDYLKDQEFACVGTGLGGVFTNTEELVRMKYKEVMSQRGKIEIKRGFKFWK